MIVLLVEDDRDLAANIGEFLESAGHRVDYASNGLLARRLCSENRYDAIVLDVGLPGASGLDVCRWRGLRRWTVAADDQRELPAPLLVPDLQTAEARLIARAVDGHQDRIKRLLEREKSLTDDISHELRTPTSVITTASELLLDDPTVAGVARERVGRIARAARKTGAIVEALLFLGREDSGNTAVAVELRGVVRDGVEIFRPVAQAKGIELLADCSSEQWITAPPGTLSIMLRNLVGNAIRFTEHGSVRVFLGPGRLIVEDTGVGLAGVDSSRIFERGYRSDASQGSGLGLDLTRRICGRVGWQVSAHPRSTGGARFEVIFAGPTVA